MLYHDVEDGYWYVNNALFSINTYCPIYISTSTVKPLLYNVCKATTCKHDYSALLTSHYYAINTLS